MPKAPVKLRLEVAAFAELMELKLRENDHKGKKGWKKDSAQILLSRLCDELAEVLESFTAPVGDMPHKALLIGAYEVRSAATLLRHYTPTLSSDFAEMKPTTGKEREAQGIYHSSAEEAVDVANFCMMLVDVLGGL